MKGIFVYWILIRQRVPQKCRHVRLWRKHDNVRQAFKCIQRRKDYFRRSCKTLLCTCFDTSLASKLLFCFCVSVLHWRIPNFPFANDNTLNISFMCGGNAYLPVNWFENMSFVHMACFQSLFRLLDVT